MHKVQMSRWKKLRLILTAEILKNTMCKRQEMPAVTWSQLLELDGTVVTRQFPRTELVERHYREHRESMGNNQAAIREHIINNDLTINGRLVDYAVWPNSFPYDVEPGVYHLVFWIQPGREYTVQDVRDIMQRKLPGFDAVVFRNAPENMSVSLVPHYHVFIRARH